MKNNKLVLILFSVVIVFQLLIPLRMVLRSEAVLQTGELYKFKTRPIDPYDPFIGKYIVLDFEISRIENDFNFEAAIGGLVYVYLDVDDEGFAEIVDVSYDNHKKGIYVKAELKSATESLIRIEFPFNRYYMREDIAKEAEMIHARLSRDEEHVTYALVSIKDGNAVVEGVYIDDIPIEEMVVSEKSVN